MPRKIRISQSIRRGLRAFIPLLDANLFSGQGDLWGDLESMDEDDPRVIQFLRDGENALAYLRQIAFPEEDA